MDLQAGTRVGSVEIRSRLSAAIGVGRTYYVAPDGRRFLMAEQTAGSESSETAFFVVQNWFEELQKLVPGKYPWRARKSAAQRRRSSSE